MDASEADVPADMAFPAQHLTRPHSTDPLEWLNKQFKRWADVVGIIPSAASIIRLFGAVLLEQNDAWSVRTRYMRVEAMVELVAIDAADPIQIPPPSRPDRWPPHDADESPPT